MPMRRISYCINQPLTDICQRAILLENLTAKVRQFLPVNLQSHCKISNFNNGCLTICIDDPVWATDLRYSLPDLRDKLRIEAGLYQLVSIKLEIAVEPPATIPSAKTRNVLLSETAKSIIRQTGNACNYLPLKKSLLHLADG